VYNTGHQGFTVVIMHAFRQKTVMFINVSNQAVGGTQVDARYNFGPAQGTIQVYVNYPHVMNVYAK
jgi:hypothetical protein